MKCENCGRETDFVIIATLGWYVMDDGKTLFMKGLSPASRKRMLCLDCFGRCAKVFKKEDV